MQVHTTALFLFNVTVFGHNKTPTIHLPIEVDRFQSLFSLTWINRFVQTLKGVDVVSLKGSRKFALSDISLAWTNSPIAFSPCSLALTKDSETSDV